MLIEAGYRLKRMRTSSKDSSRSLRPRDYMIALHCVYAVTT